ncbi:hypothetical protein GCM10009678_00770 [Actinomadura kijaniata]|uniref:hypothetical protein n=1 Tax=Actinomadura kijaniata TaxID=46161 RepID=UPI0028AC70E3|nr:hypothetical protein [Actinomadura namibiensis]
MELGPFRLSARLGESSAGIVYLGSDGSGRQVSVAVLNRGAAGDAAARDRFRAAILREWRPGQAPVGEGPAVEGSGRAPVVAAQPDGPAPWVATAYGGERAGAERFLEPVLLEGTFRGRWAGRRRGPQFQPYWAGSGEPAVPGRAPVPVAAPVVRQERGLVAAILTLAAVLLVLALLMLLLFACQPKVEQPPPPPPEPTPSSQTPSQTPSTPRPSPTPTSPAPSPTSPGPTEGPGDDGAPL